MKLTTQPYRGARDFYPDDMRLQNYIFDTWKKVCNLYGFEQYYFPVLEPFEIFAAKSGQELVNEQLFSFEDQGGRKLALRPELTPSTVRMIAARYGELPRPIKWFMIGDNWRYERPQKGRGREFFQLEVNIFGVEEVTADFEIFSVGIELMKAFGATEKMFEIRFNDRKLVLALLKDYMKLSDNISDKIRKVMDKRNKVSKENFFEMLAENGLDKKQQEIVENLISSTFTNLPRVIPQKVLDQNKGYQNLKELISLLEGNNLIKYCRFDASVIRGFDYSDGLVYEIFDKNPQNVRSIFGGERFDKLTEIFGNYDLPATGFALGDYTLKDFLTGWNLLPKLEDQIEYFVTLWPSENVEESRKFLRKSVLVAEKLRSNGVKVLMWLDRNTKLDKQLKYADKKNAKFAVLIGPDEIEKNTATLKDLSSGKQTTLDAL